MSSSVIMQAGKPSTTNHVNEVRLSDFRPVILDKCQRCEVQLRIYFGLPATNAQATMTHDLVSTQGDRVLNVQLTNFLYDTYIRLLMLGYRRLFIQHPLPVSTCLKLALTKFDSTLVEFTVNRPAQTANEASLPAITALFDALTLRFDTARKNGSMLFLDPLLTDYVAQLQDDSLAHIGSTATEAGSSLAALIAQDYRDEEADEPSSLTEQSSLTTVEGDPCYAKVRWLTVLQTFYRPKWDHQLIDHRHHYEQAYIPVYRFGDEAVAAMSMSSYIGNTMRRNIRLLYDFITCQLRQLTGVEPICPCVVIFNLFVRDHFRVYHSKSLPQTSFIQIYDDQSGKHIKISYMLIANQFPKISQWFNSINNQFIKKTGYARILYIDAYVRLIASACQAAMTTPPNHDPHKTKKSRRRKKSIFERQATIKRLGEAPVSARQESQLPAASKLTLTAKRKERLTLSQLFRVDWLRRVRDEPCKAKKIAPVDASADSQSFLLSSAYRSGFLTCNHRHVVRVYTQKRAHDESASLSIFCNDCHCYL